MIECIQTEARFEALADEWRQLAAAAGAWGTYAWARSAWRVNAAAGGRLWILRWHREGVAGGVLFPFWLDPAGTLRLLGDDFTDYGDAVYAGDADRLHLAFREAAEAVLAEPAVKRVDFKKLTAGGALLDYFSALLPHALVYRAPAGSFLRVERSDDPLSSLAGLTSHDRSALKAMVRKAREDGCVFRVLGSADAVAFPRLELQRLAAAMVAAGRRQEEFLSAELLDFAAELFAAGLLRLAVFERSGRLVAVSFVFVHAGRELNWICLNDRPQRMTALYAAYLETAGRERSLTLDFGAGAYAWKLGTFRPRVAANFTLRWSRGRLDRLRDFARMVVRGWRL